MGPSAFDEAAKITERVRRAAEGEFEFVRSCVADAIGKSGQSLDGLHRVTGLGENTMRRFLDGESAPTLRNVLLICAALDRRLDDIMRDRRREK